MENNIWFEIKERLKIKNPNNKGLETWVEPIVLLSNTEENKRRKIKLGVPTDLHRYWVSQHLFDSICSEISNIYSQEFELDLVVLDPKVSVQNNSIKLPSDLESMIKPVGSEKQLNLLNKNDFLLTKKENSNLSLKSTLNISSSFSSSVDSRASIRKDFLNPEYTFSSFVVGRNNEFAHAASFSVAENPGGKYNPLFICGPTGMGKTHLLNAVGYHISENKPNCRILYVSAEKFLNECISGIRRQEMDRFRARYREKCDILLMDDIQILGKGERVQEEFFYTLNAFFETGRQVVVASDRMPKDINGLEDRIRTRLEWGLIADIQMPDMETRVAILRYKAERLTLQVPDEVINFLGRISKRSIRELEGNLNKVKMFSELQGLSISLELTKKVLATHCSEAGHLSMEDVQKLVAKHYDVKILDLKSSVRARPIVTARQMAMFLTKKYLNKSLVDIGRAFGGKDHTTVINAIRRIEDQLNKNTDLKKDLDEIESRIHNITGV